MNPLAKHFSLGGLLRFAAPAVGMMLVISIYTVTDGIFIGRYAGSLALAASNIVYPALNLVFGLSIMLSSGGSALVAKTLGEGDAALARGRFTLLAVVGAALGILFAGTVFLFMEPILALLGASPELYADCRSYLSANMFFAPFGFLYRGWPPRAGLFRIIDSGTCQYRTRLCVSRALRHGHLRRGACYGAVGCRRGALGSRVLFAL